MKFDKLPENSLSARFLPADYNVYFTFVKLFHGMIVIDFFEEWGEKGNANIFAMIEIEEISHSKKQCRHSDKADVHRTLGDVAQPRRGEIISVGQRPTNRCAHPCVAPSGRNQPYLKNENSN